MSGSKRFIALYEHGKEAAAGGFVVGLFFRFLEGPCEYPGTCNVFGFLSGIFGLISLVGLISLIIGFIGKNRYHKYELIIEKKGEAQKVRPWVRLFARLIDYWIWINILNIIAPSVAIFIVYWILINIVSILVPSVLDVSNIAFDIIFIMLALFIWVFMEASLLSTWGTTLGKWFFKTKITDSLDKKLTFSKALDRSFSVWWKGLAAGLPIIYLITLSNAYKKLTKEGIATWDREVGCAVSHKKIGAPRVLLVLLLMVFMTGYADVLPRDRYIEIGNSNYVLSIGAQQFLDIYDVSDYEKTKSLIIINEPHYDLEQQFNLYKGLEIFFNDNPTLVNKTIFLSEGLPSNQSLSVKPLIDVEPSPSEELIREVLGTYLIPGYIAYEWKYQKNIPIDGTEDKGLYDFSARSWVETQDQAQNKDILNLWQYTVVARNRNMAYILDEKMQTYENPILFVGGLHLNKQDDDDFQKIKYGTFNNSLDIEPSYLKSYENLGLYDYLKKGKIGYTFIVERSNLKSKEDEERNVNIYIRLFKAQQSGDYTDYIEGIIFKKWLNNYDRGVTVTASPEAAAKFVSAFSNANNKEKQKNNPPPVGGILGKFLHWLDDKMRWVDDKGVYTWHDWETGKKPHWDFGGWDGETQLHSYDGINWIPD